MGFKHSKLSIFTKELVFSFINPPIFIILLNYNYWDNCKSAFLLFTLHNNENKKVLKVTSTRVYKLRRWGGQWSEQKQNKFQLIIIGSKNLPACLQVGLAREGYWTKVGNQTVLPRLVRTELYDFIWSLLLKLVILN